MPGMNGSYLCMAVQSVVTPSILTDPQKSSVMWTQEGFTYSRNVRISLLQVSLLQISRDGIHDFGFVPPNSEFLIPWSQGGRVQPGIPEVFCHLLLFEPRRYMSVEIGYVPSV